MQTATRVDRPPETLGQARAWDKNQNRYLRSGFCARCASAAAWGHQSGWSSVPPVCPTCKYLSVPARIGKTSEGAMRWAAGINTRNRSLHPRGGSERAATATPDRLVGAA